MQRPASRSRETPIGLHLDRVAKLVSRAFDDALADAGGSRPVWLVLLSLKIRSMANQRELADAVGIRGGTLTHHLNAMEADGLVTRERDPENRRSHLVRLTPKGERLFLQLRGAAMQFDKRLRDGFTSTEVGQLASLLTRLQANVLGQRDGSPRP
jgi:MarR family transcriptional regulator, transcriptional regulator for hemolysin